MNHTPLDVAIAELAGRQHGVIAFWQLIELGLGKSAIADRVRVGRLHRVYRGVYSVGHSILTAKGRCMAAVLACGEGAVLSHRSAADLWGIRQSSRPLIDVTAPGGAGRRIAGIDAHRAKLTPEDVTTVDGIPCTTLARTFLDLAEVTGRAAVEKAMNEAEILRIYDNRAVEAQLERSNGRRGSRILIAILKSQREPKLTRNDLEQLMLEICRKAGLPEPLVNALIDGHELDFAWPDLKLTVETDGWETHGTRRAFERDRKRDRHLRRKHWRVERFTWREVAYEPDAVAEALIAAAAAP